MGQVMQALFMQVEWEALVGWLSLFVIALVIAVAYLGWKLAWASARARLALTQCAKLEAVVDRLAAEHGIVWPLPE